VRGGEDARGARRGAAWRGRVAGAWTSEVVSLDNFGGMRGVARCAARELARCPQPCRGCRPKVRETPKRTEFCLSSSVRASATPHSSASRKRSRVVCYLQPACNTSLITGPSRKQSCKEDTKERHEKRQWNSSH